MTDNTTTETQDSRPVCIGGRKAAVLRQGGNLCDIRRHNSGFLYGPHRVAVSEELLKSLPDTTVLQFTNMDSRDVWTCTVRDFRHMSEPIQFGSYEPQRCVEIARLNKTIEGKPKRGKKRVNELVHIDQTPAPEYSQSTLFERITR